ncbi:MAG: hypothetical protein FJY67_06250 [Calditrichaeota bacterium]|nr:hypothetical protein [Calditrichota bacterium]
MRAILMMMMMIIGIGYAGTPELLFEAGSRHYLAGEYSEAIAKWSQALEAGVADGALLYNLGNAYFKIDDLGRAILYWERAARMIGEDADLKSNLAIARARLVDKTDESVRLPVWDAVDRIRDALPAATLGWLAIILSLLTFGLMALRRWGRGMLRALTSGRWIVKPFGILLTLILSLLILKWQAESAIQTGIIVAPEAEVLSAPSTGSAKLLFTLHAGTKARVLRKVGEWYEITVGSERQGWVQSEAIGVI